MSYTHSKSYLRGTGVYAVCAGIVLACSVRSVASAATLTVWPDGRGDYPTIQAAVDAAGDGDTVSLQPGFFRGPGNRDVTITCTSITIVGHQSHQSASTVIDCQGSPFEHHRAFTVEDVDGEPVIFEQLWIVNACPPATTVLDNDDGVHAGAAILARRASVTVRHCIFAHMNTQHGVVHVEQGSCLVSHSSFVDCDETPSQRPPLVPVLASPAVISVVEGICTVDNCDFNGRIGGVYVSDSQACRVQDCSFYDCTNGIIAVLVDDVHVHNSIFSNFVYDRSRYYGMHFMPTGVFLHGVDNGHIERCKLEALQGTAIDVRLSTLTVRDSFLTGCTNANNCGSLIYAIDVSMNLINNTIADNVYEANPLMMVKADSQLTLVNTILSHNTAPEGLQLAAYATRYMGQQLYPELSISYSTIAGGHDTLYLDEGTVLHWDEPTILTEPTRFGWSCHHTHYALSADADEIDAGDYAVCDALPHRRIFDGDGDGRAVIDIGASEYRRGQFLIPHIPPYTTSVPPVTYVVTDQGILPDTEQQIPVTLAGFGPYVADNFVIDNGTIAGPWITLGMQRTRDGNVLTIAVDPVVLNALPRGRYYGQVRPRHLFPRQMPLVNVIVDVRSPEDIHVPEEYPTLNQAMYNAQPGNRILLADGEYDGVEFCDMPVVDKHLEIRSYSGDPASCIIDGHAEGQGLMLKYGAFDCTGITFRNMDGPAVTGEYATVHLADCVIRNCTRHGVVFDNCDSTIEHCQFISNGGSGIIVLDDWFFPPQEPYYGGGVSVSSGTADIRYCVFERNAATYGGAVCADALSQLSIESCRFLSNHASSYWRGSSGGEPGQGGALYVTGPATISHSYISDCEADYGGGMYLRGSVELHNTILCGNVARARGGGIYSIRWGSDVHPTHIDRSTIMDNRASDGAGVCVAGDCVHLTNSIVYGNGPEPARTMTRWIPGDGDDYTGRDWDWWLPRDTGGDNFDRMVHAPVMPCPIERESRGPQLAVFHDSRYLGGDDGYEDIPGELSVAWCDVAGGVNDVYVDDISSLHWQVGNFDADPMVAVPGRWIEDDTPPFTDDRYEPGDYHLQSAGGRWDPTALDGAGGWVVDRSTSQCIDAGLPATDIGDEVEPHGWRINIGAYAGTVEASMTNPCDLNFDGEVDFDDFNVFARYWQGQGAELPPDFNHDGMVDWADFGIFAVNWEWGIR